MLKLENVTKHYKDFCLDCSMEVKPGRITGLIGQNGAGKSTIFKAVLNLIFPESGIIRMFGKPVSELTARDRENIGVVLSDSGFSAYLSIGDIIPVLDSLYTAFDPVSFRRKCEEYHLPLNKKIKDFSTGMKATLKVLIAISHGASLLLLDEPTAGLDVIARNRLLEMLRSYMETGDCSILISSHISGDLEGLCDDVYMIDKGQIVLHEETDVLLDYYGVLKVTPDQYESLDKKYILRCSREEFGYQLLTDQKQFYLENYPDAVIEKGCIDTVITMMIKGQGKF